MMTLEIRSKQRDADIIPAPARWLRRVVTLVLLVIVAGLVMAVVDSMTH